MGYAVFHATKGSGGGGKLGAHIDRDKKQKQTFKSADPEREHLNKNLISKNSYSEMKLPDAINERIKEGYKGKKALRKDAVKFIPMVMTGSREEMKKIFDNKDLKQKWLQANYNFVCKEFGEKNIVRFTLHLDEKTPHIHAVVVPLTDDGRLSAKERFGNRNVLSDRQTRYADAMQQFGLKRGVVGSKSKHTSEGWYIGKQLEAEKAILNPLERLNFLERLNPLKKIEVLTEGLKLAQNHKFDSEQKTKREEAKVLQLREDYSELKKNYDKILRSESIYKTQQDKIIEKMQSNIKYEVNRLLQGRFNLHEYTPEERKNFAVNLIFEVAQKEKGVNQEIYDKAMSKGNFQKNLSEAVEVRAEQNQERENKSQNRSQGMKYN